MTSDRRAIVACDLDRTIVYSAGSMALDCADTEAPPMVVSEVYNGAPLSFMTAAAERMLDALATRQLVVPATTRTVAQYRRVRLPGPTPAFAVTTNGGVILTNGAPDADWGAAVAKRCDAECAGISEIERLLRPGGELPPWVRRLARAEELFCYAIVDREVMPEEYVAEIHAGCVSRGWTVSLQGRKLYCIPTPLSKAHAVEEIRRRTGATFVIAAGDSLLDREMLDRATLAFRPRHGELEDTGHTGPNLTVTSARGIRAGEEILTRISAQLSAR